MSSDRLVIELTVHRDGGRIVERYGANGGSLEYRYGYYVPPRERFTDRIRLRLIEWLAFGGAV